MEPTLIIIIHPIILNATPLTQLKLYEKVLIPFFSIVIFLIALLISKQPIRDYFTKFNFYNTCSAFHSKLSIVKRPSPAASNKSVIFPIP